MAHDETELRKMISELLTVIYTTSGFGPADWIPGSAPARAEAMLANTHGDQP